MRRDEVKECGDDISNGKREIGEEDLNINKYINRLTACQ
jgi:hypothetical protein